MKKKRILLIILMCLVIIALIFIAILIIKNFQKNRFKKILEENDYSNYKCIETTDDGEKTTYIKDGVMLSIEDNYKIWISEKDKERYIIDENNHMFMITKDDDDLKVNTLNYSYINEYFENSNESFKYLGKEDGYFLLQFYNKKNDITTVLYLNMDSNLIEKIDRSTDENIVTIKIETNIVKNEDVELPDLDGYYYENSYSSKTLLENSESSEKAVNTENNDNNNDTNNIDNENSTN